MACDLLHAKGLSRGHVVDRLVHGAAFGCLLLALGCLVWMLTGLVSTGWSGFSQSEVRLAISYPLEGEIKAPQLLKEALLTKLPALEPADQRMAARLISSKAPFELVTHLKTHPALRGKTEDVWVLLSDEADMQVKGKAVAGKLQPVQEAALATLHTQGDIRTAFNWRLFANTDSREPEAAGLLGGLAGTLWVMVLALLMVLPVGIAAAVWFEEFANRTLFTRILEICLNNLPAVPASVRTIYQGLQYENGGLSSVVNSGTDEQKKWIQQNTDIPAFDIASFTITNNKKKIPSAEVKTSLVLNRLATVSGKRMFITPNLMNKISYIPEKTVDRKNLVVRKMAFTDVDTVVYKIPEEVYPEFVP